MTTAGKWLNSRRLACGLGLREFAELIGDAPSNVCNIEKGRRVFWKNRERLERVAEALRIAIDSPEWGQLLILSGTSEKLPTCIEEVTSRPIVHALLKEIASRNLSQADVALVVRYVRMKFAKKVTA